MKPAIKWNADLFGVEIKTDDEHFVIEASPTKVMKWHEAMSYYNDAHRIPTRKLPTVPQMRIVGKHIYVVNNLIKENRGHELRGWYWTDEESGEACAWIVLMDDGYTLDESKDFDCYVRAVYDLNN